LVLDGYDPLILFVKVFFISLIVVLAVWEERRCMLVVFILCVKVVKGAQDKEILALCKLGGVKAVAAFVVLRRQSVPEIACVQAALGGLVFMKSRRLVLVFLGFGVLDFKHRLQAPL